MERESMDQFLKRRAPFPPPAPLGEKQQIWRAIEAVGAKPSWWLAIYSRPRLLASAAVLLAVSIGVLVQHQMQRSADIERVLTAALMYQMEEDNQSMF